MSIIVRRSFLSTLREHVFKFPSKPLTYDELIHWIFDETNWTEIQQYKPYIIGLYSYHWLEFWYERLYPEIKDNKFVLGGFHELLMNWFEKNNLMISIYPLAIPKFTYYISSIDESMYITQVQYREFDTSQQAKYAGILKCFELFKNK